MNSISCDGKLKQDRIGRRAVDRRRENRRAPGCPRPSSWSRAGRSTSWPRSRRSARCRSSLQRCARRIAEDMAARNAGDLSWPASCHRRGHEGKPRSAPHKAPARSAFPSAARAAGSLRHPHLADDVGRGVPARERVHHEDQADREWRARHLPEIGRGRREGDRLRRSGTTKPATRKATISTTFRTVEIS